MNDDYDDGPEAKSKSQLKREASAAQNLGRTLVEMPATRFKTLITKLDLPDNLRAALAECRTITAHGGRRRQLQYIGKLMRSIDTAPIEQAIDALEGKDRASAAFLRRLEHWRERLITEGDSALTELLNEYPSLDRQRLRRLVTKAHKERDTGQPPAAARALFKELRLMAAASEEGEEHKEE